MSMVFVMGLNAYFNAEVLHEVPEQCAPRSGGCVKSPKNNLMIQKRNVKSTFYQLILNSIFFNLPRSLKSIPKKRKRCIQSPDWIPISARLRRM